MGTSLWGQQIILQITVCFSLLNLAFTLSLNKGKDFSRVLGLCFSLPFVLGLFSIFTLGSVFGQSLFAYHNLFFLGTICSVSFLWTMRQYKISILALWLSPVICVLAVKYMPDLPLMPFLLKNLSSPFFSVGLTILIIATLLHILVKMMGEKDPKLILAVLLVGIFQVLYFLMPTNSLILIAVGNFLGYLLFSIYVHKKSREPYVKRIKQAEAKLGDMNKTIHYEVKKRLLEIERHNEHLLNMVQKDPLVEAYNKKGIMNLMRELVHDPSKEPFTIMLFDIDNFKNINDTKGHVAGDMILRKVCHIAKANIRGFDILGRYGGDEFLIILPRTMVSDALFIAERFRKKVDQESEISVSIGLATFPDDGETIKGLLEAADAGLYEAKGRGKNAVSHFPSR